VSLPLKDIRFGITEATHAMLEARAEAEGLDMLALARRVLSEWAAREHRGYMVYAKRLASNGLQTELPGFEVEDAGSRRSGEGKRRG